jgi:hypothetical protein
MAAIKGNGRCKLSVYRVRGDLPPAKKVSGTWNAPRPRGKDQDRIRVIEPHRQDFGQAAEQAEKYSDFLACLVPGQLAPE